MLSRTGIGDRRPSVADRGGRCPKGARGSFLITVDCDKASLCAEMCACDASGCKAVDDVFYTLDIAFDGASAEGTISLWNTNYTLRLKRKTTQR